MNHLELLNELFQKFVINFLGSKLWSFINHPLKNSAIINLHLSKVSLSSILSILSWEKYDLFVKKKNSLFIISVIVPENAFDCRKILNELFKFWMLIFVYKIFFMFFLVHNVSTFTFWHLEIFSSYWNAEKLLRVL